MPAYDAYGTRRAMESREDTWGHLAPKRGRVYKGTILLAEGCFAGAPCVIKCEFGDLPSSPWFYDHLCEFIAQSHDSRREPGLYRFEGTYRFVKPRTKNYLDQCQGLFDGDWTVVPIPD